MKHVRSTKEVIDQYYRNIQEGNTDAEFNLFSENIVTYVPGKSIISGIYRGHAGMREFYKLMNNQMGDHFTINVNPLVIDKNYAVSTENIEINRKDSPEHIWKYQLAIHFYIIDGLIQEIHMTPYDQYYYDAYYGIRDDLYINKVYRFTYETGWEFDVEFTSANSIKFFTVGDPTGGTLIGETGSNNIYPVKVNDGIYWFSWQELTDLQTTVTMLVDFNQLKMQAYMTFRGVDDKRSELFHSGSLTEIDVSKFGIK